MTVALGITTMNRPAYFKALAKSVYRHLDVNVYVYNDGSDPKHTARYEAAYKLLPHAFVDHANENRGVAFAKNELLRRMLRETNADWLFLAEDDMRVTSPDAIDGYIRACNVSGLHHLSFAHHGPANAPGPVATDDNLDYFFHIIGSWCIYSRECIEAVGPFDENFHNAWEHVEHSARIAARGFTTPPYQWADAKGSREWIAEQDGAIANSSIRPGGDHEANKRNGLRYWRDTKPETFAMMFGPGTPLHQFAMSLLEGV